jgi:hypothetical protein
MPAALPDTNAVSDLMRDDPQVRPRMASHPDPVLTNFVAEPGPASDQLVSHANACPRSAAQPIRAKRLNALFGAVSHASVRHETAPPRARK